MRRQTHFKLAEMLNSMFNVSSTVLLYQRIGVPAYALRVSLLVDHSRKDNMPRD